MLKRYYTEGNSTYMAQKMKEYWDSEDGKQQLVTTNDEGIEKVRLSKRKYAFLCETMIAKYYINRKPCDLVIIGEPFGKHLYGFAIPNNHPFEEPLNQAILELGETGDLEALEEKWWTGKGECFRRGRPRRNRTSWFDIPAKQVSVESHVHVYGIVMCILIF